MNVSMLIGRLTGDVTLRHTAGTGKAVANFDIAVPRQYKRDESDFFKIVVWGKSAENCAKYTTKGKLIGIVGRLQNEKWEDNNGNKRSRDVVVADNVEFIEWADKGQSNNNNSGYVDVPDDSEDSVPF